jgi:hypothetical protein
MVDTLDGRFPVTVVIGRENDLSFSDIQHVRWFYKHFSFGASLKFVSVPENQSVVNSLFSTVDGCSYYFMIDNSTQFSAPGWTFSLVSALRSFGSPFVGAVRPANCSSCVFVGDVHNIIFSRHPFPLDQCWVDWVGLVYGGVVTVDGVSVQSTGTSSVCYSVNESISDLVSLGRLHISKFLLLRSTAWIRL